MRIAIVGSRGYRRMDQVVEYVKNLPKDTIVVSGGARGVDRVAVLAARRFGIATEVYLAQWDKDGNQAGFIRNTEMLERCDHVVAFWDGHSHGTLHMAQIARRAEKLMSMYGPEGGEMTMIV